MKTSDWISVKTSLPPPYHLKKIRNGLRVMSFGFMTKNADSAKVILMMTTSGVMQMNAGI